VVTAAVIRLQPYPHTNHRHTLHILVTLVCVGCVSFSYSPRCYNGVSICVKGVNLVYGWWHIILERVECFPELYLATGSDHNSKPHHNGMWS